MNYEETLTWLFSQLPMYQREGQAAYKANLDNTIKLDEHFNHPYQNYKTVHVAGTNGKGSTSHMLASILQEAGYKTGLYTSPHLKDFRERIKVDGEMISEDYVTDFVESNKDFFEEIQPSFFEMTVAMAFKYFSDMEVDVAIIEVGLGGRLDSTNIITPELAIITNISYDHMGLLGNTLEKIATEKAGIIKPNIPVIVGTRDTEYDFVFQQKAAELNAPLIFASDIWKVERIDNCHYTIADSNGNTIIDNLDSELKGDYQAKNFPAVIEAAFTLQSKGFAIYEKDIKDGIENVVKNTGLLGRWQKLSDDPLTICDTGHNVAGIREIVKQLNTYTFDKLHFVIGVVNDKEIDDILELLPKDAIYYFCKASIPRALDENILSQKAAEHGLKGKTYPTVAEAYEAAREKAGYNDLLFIGGSTFVVAEIV